MVKYDKCKKCGENAVHCALYTAGEWWVGDDGEDGSGKYANAQPPYLSEYITLFAHVCFECGELVDVGIESPRDKVINTSTREEEKEQPDG